MSTGKTAVIGIISILFFSMVLGPAFAQPKGVQPIYPAPEQWKAAKARKNYVIGGCVPMLGAPYWRNLSYGVFNATEKAGAKLLFYDAGGYQYLEKQVKQVEDLIERKVDAIVICPCSSKGTVEVLERAISKGIVVVNTVSWTYSEKINSAVLDDDYKVGKLQAERIIEKLNGKGKGVMLCGPAGSDWAMNRVKGFKETIAKYPGIQVLSEKWSEPTIEDAQKVMDDLLQTFPDMQFCYTAADGMSMGAANAVRGAKKLGAVIITTASFSPEGADYLKKGWTDIDVGESPILEGAWAIDVAVKALNGEAYPKLVYVPNPPFTKDNMNDPKFAKYIKYQWAPQGWKVPSF